MSEAEVRKIAVLEARYLDDWRLDEWLDLFTEDGIYWLPIDENADPAVAHSITFDDGPRRAMRVDQLLNQGGRASQSPRPEVMHLIGHIDVDLVGDDAATAQYGVLIAELRPGDWRLEGLGQQRLLAARCSLRLRRVAGSWKIEEKKLVLLRRRQPLDALTSII